MRLPFSKVYSLADPPAILVAIPVSIIIVVGTGLSIRAHSLLRKDRELVVHSYQVLVASDRLLLSITNAETAQRGFVLTGESDFLEPYEAARMNGIPKQLDVLQHLLADSQSQESRVSMLRTLTAEKLSEMSDSIDTFQKGGLSAAQPLIAARSGKDWMDKIRRVIDDIQLNESQLVERRSAEVHKDEQEIVYVAIATTAISTLLRIGIALFRRRRTHHERGGNDILDAG